MPERNALAPRPTNYCGIAMRSRLEARYASWLDQMQVLWEYEPFCFADGKRQYLPDFVVHHVNVLSGQRSVYIDVKPFWPLGDLTERMTTIWATDPTAVLAIEAADLDYVALRLPPDLGIDRWLAWQWGQSPDGATLAPRPARRRSWTHFEDA